MVLLIWQMRFASSWLALVAAWKIFELTKKSSLVLIARRRHAPARSASLDANRWAANAKQRVKRHATCDGLAVPLVDHIF